jgi:outer membrane protein assembly factor BamA
MEVSRRRAVASLGFRASARLIPFLVALLLPCLASAQPAPPPVVPEQLYNEPIIDVVVRGPPWAVALKGDLRLLVGTFVTRGGSERALLYLQQKAPVNLASVQASVEKATDGRRHGARVVFDVTPVRHVEDVDFRETAPLDRAALSRAAALLTGAEFWPDTIQKAAARVAALYFRAGWRETSVSWEATEGKNGLRITFTVHRSAPTTLVEIEFLGDKGLNDKELATAFDIQPGARLSMDLIDEGIVEVKARYRGKRFYRASVGLPRVDTADNRAVVQIPLSAGPQFSLLVRGNRAFDDNQLLEQLHYKGEEPLDRNTERDLSEKLRNWYELAGYPFARVLVDEGPPHPAHPPPPAHVTLRDDAPIGPPPLIPLATAPPSSEAALEQAVTFVVAEGPPIRVVEIELKGMLLPDHPAKDLRRRIQLALQDIVPPELVNSRDATLLRAARIGGAPGEVLHASPHVEPEEVFAREGYKNACEQISNLYKAQGYLDAQVGPAELVQVGGGKAHAVIQIDPGQQTFVARIDIEGRSAMPTEKVAAAISLKVGQPLSYADVDASRKALIQLYQGQGYLSVDVEDLEQPVDPADPTHEVVTLRIAEGVQVHASSINVEGTNAGTAKLVERALKISPGGLITPDAEEESVRNLIKLGIFASATVKPADADRPETVLRVILQEKPGLTLDLSGGISLVDGPRVKATFGAAHFLGTNNTFTLDTRADLPIFRFCLYGITGCPIGITQPRTPVEYLVNAGVSFPLFGAPGTVPSTQQIALIAQNLLRPNYFLQKFSVLGSLDGLPRARWGAADFNTLIQLEVEDDLFQRVATDIQYAETFTDQRTYNLMPEGQTTLVSFRPTFRLDARDNKLNPTSGGTVELALDLSQSFGNGGGIFVEPPGTPSVFVSLLSVRLTASGYIPIYRPGRVVLFVWGRGGYIDSTLFNKNGDLIGTKAFFLGGTETLRGFNEDELIPQDTRSALHGNIATCSQLVSQVGCNTATLGLIRSGGQSAISPGGSVVLAGRGELRFGIASSFDGAVFLDAGNLWYNPTTVSTQLRYATGFGIRTALPIGPAAVDFGFNLAPDYALGESVFRLHFSIGGG